jgi:hypothetical protein
VLTLVAYVVCMPTVTGSILLVYSRTAESVRRWFGNLKALGSIPSLRASFLCFVFLIKKVWAFFMLFNLHLKTKYIIVLLIALFILFRNLNLIMF